MKPLSAIILALVAFAPVAPAFSAKGAGQEERVQHYAAKEIHSKTEALKELAVESAKIEEILKAEKMDDTKMEAIHEITYTLEACVDYLVKEKTLDKEKLAAVDEAVQGLHYASEHHQETKTRDWASALQAAIVPLD